MVDEPLAYLFATNLILNIYPVDLMPGLATIVHLMIAAMNVSSRFGLMGTSKSRLKNLSKETWTFHLQMANWLEPTEGNGAVISHGSHTTAAR